MDAMMRRRMMMAEVGGSPTPPPVIEPVFYDFLVFDGAAYIDTTIIPEANSTISVPLGNETTKGAQHLFMCACANSTQIGAVLTSSTTSTRRYFGVYYGASSAVSTNRYLNFSYTTYNFFITPNRFGWGNANYTFTKGSNSPTGGLVLGSKSSHDGNPYTGTMGIFRIFGTDAQNETSYNNIVNNHTPVVTLRPCTYNGQAGIWYVEGNTFYGNTAGAGTLTVRNNT